MKKILAPAAAVAAMATILIPTFADTGLSQGAFTIESKSTNGYKTFTGTAGLDATGGEGGDAGPTPTAGAISLQLNLDTPNCQTSNFYGSVPAGSQVPTTMAINGGAPVTITGNERPLGVTNGIVDVEISGNLSTLGQHPDFPRFLELKEFIETQERNGVSQDDIMILPEYAELLILESDTAIQQGMAPCILSIDSWDNDLGLTNVKNLFTGNEILTSVATPPSNLADLSYMFNRYMGTTPLPLNAWSTSHVTNMEHMFDNATGLQADLSSWDTANVTNMSHMFNLTPAFNSDLSNWETGSVTDMSRMFNSSGSLTSDLSGWDVSSVTNMRSMFEGASLFNSNLSDWQTNNVTNMSHMFYNALAFDSDLNGDWNTSNVTNMSHMFRGAIAFDGNVSNWSTNATTDMSHMFRDATAFTGNLNDWDTSAVITMESMFENTQNFNSNLEDWNTSNVTAMNHMFASSQSFTQDVSSWDVCSTVSDPRGETTNREARPYSVSFASNASSSWLPAHKPSFSCA